MKDYSTILIDVKIPVPDKYCNDDFDPLEPFNDDHAAEFWSNNLQDCIIALNGDISPLIHPLSRISYNK